jgi:hypothetical protein
MYSNTDLKALVVEANKSIIDNDRSLYNDCYTLIEQFCVDNGGYIAGNNAISMTLGIQPTVDSYVYDIYTASAYQFSKDLTDKLATIKPKHIPMKSLSLITRIKHSELEIVVFGRSLCKIYQMNKIEVLKPTICDGWFVKGLSVIHPLLLLIKLYGKLKVSIPAPNIDDLLNIEKELVDRLGRGYKGGDDEDGGDDIDKEGGGHNKGKYHHNNKDKYQHKPPHNQGRKKFADVLEAEKRLLNNIQQEYVLVGDYTWKENPGRLQLIVAEETAVFNDYKRGGLQGASLAPISLFLPGEPLLRKFTIFQKRGNESFAVADLYNFAEYELVPKVSSIYVARVYLIEMWLMHLYSAESRLNELYNGFMKTRVSDYEFPTDIKKYIGEYENEVVIGRKMNKMEVYIPPYYPLIDS